MNKEQLWKEIMFAITNAEHGYTYETWVDYEEATDNVMSVLESNNLI